MRKLIAIATIGAALALLLHPSFGSTSAIFSQTTNNQSNQFAGATFSPTVAPVVIPASKAASITLTWPAVTVSSGAVITYVVMRRPLTGPAVEVCTGTKAPIASGADMTCNDTSVTTGVAYTYTEQPIVVRSAVTTWSLTASAPSASVCAKACK